MKNIIIRASNQRLTPYRTRSYDNIQVQYSIFDSSKKTFLSNISCHLWLKYPTAWQQYIGSISNKGQNIINMSCISFANLNSCLGYVKASINNIFLFI